MSHQQLQYFTLNDDVQVDAVKNLIFREGKEFPVSPKGIQILVYLIQKQGALASYDEFERELWHGYHSQTSLYQQIASLRRALGDSSTRPKYIKTISKQGYTFVGQCLELQAQAAEPANSPEENTASLTQNGVAESREAAQVAGVQGEGAQRNGAEPRQSAAVADSVDDSVPAFKPLRWVAFVAACFVFVALWFFVLHERITTSEHDLVIEDFATSVQLPSAIIALELPESPDDINALGVANVLFYLVKYQLENHPEYHVSIIPYGAALQDATHLQQHFAHAGGLAHSYQFVVEPQPTGKVVTLYRITASSPQRPEPERHAIASVALTSFSPQTIREFERAFLLDVGGYAKTPSHSAQFSDGLPVDEFAALMNFPQRQFLREEDFKRFISAYDRMSESVRENIVVKSAVWDIIFGALDQQNIYDTSPVLAKLKAMADRADQIAPGYFKTSHVRAEYFCRTSALEECKQSLRKAYALRPFDVGVLGNLRFFQKEFEDSSLKLDFINYHANPFAPGVFQFYRNSLLKLRDFSAAEALAKDFASWSSNKGDWYLQAQYKTSGETMAAFQSWWQQQPGNETGAGVSKYASFMLLNANFPQAAQRVYKHGIEDLPYFDLKVANVLAGLWLQQPSKQEWMAAKRLAEDRREFQNTWDKLAIIYLNMVFGELREAKRYLEEVFPEFAEDEVVITHDNFRYATYFNECIKAIGDHRRSLALDFALINYLQENQQQIKHNASFGLADVEFYVLTGRIDLAKERLHYIEENDLFQPNAYWLWPPVNANPFLFKLSETAQ